MLSEIDRMADMKNCFTEADITAVDDEDRHW